MSMLSIAKIIRMGTAVVCAFSLLSVGAIARANPLPDFDTSTSETVVVEPEIQPAALPIGAIVTAVVAVMAGSYKAAYDDGVARAASGQITWSQWQGALGWAILAGAHSAGLAGASGYQGWKNGFVYECSKHSHCIKR